MRTLRMAAFTIAALLATGCGGSSKSVTTVAPGLPTTSPASPSNNYLGTQSPGLWSLQLDHTQNAFSYKPTTYPSSGALASGNFTASNGFLNLGLTSAGASAGYAVEMQGEAAWLRPGDSTASPVLSVQQGGCFAIGGYVTFQFVAVPGQYSVYTPGALGYGSIVASTSADGKSWTFGNQVQYASPYVGGAGAGTPPKGAGSGGYVTNFSATCTETNGTSIITAPANNIVSMPTSFAISPAGFFLADESVVPLSQTALPPYSLVGVVEPSTPLSTTDVASHSYSGFLYQTGGLGNESTSPVAFAPAAATTGALAGGVYPNDDATQTAASNMVLTLGKQDAQMNGLYTGATITEPDPQQACAQNGFGIAGTDAQGNATCTLDAVAIVGNPNGEYAIFVIAFDATQQISTSLKRTGMGIYLYQQ